MSLKFYLWFVSLVILFTAVAHAVNIRPDAPEGARAVIQSAIDALPDVGGTVFIPAGQYVLDGMIHINRSHVALRGEPGTLLCMGDHVQHPNLLIGTDANLLERGEGYVPSKKDKIRDVIISGIEFDGNKDKQDSELHPAKPWLRNNAIDIRAVDDLLIEHVDTHDARSGGIVAGWHCEHITIRNVRSHHNFFDGIALYASRHVLVSDFLCYSNIAAGLSMDHRLVDITFSNGQLYENGNVGIFARDANGLNFFNLVIRDSGAMAVFLSHRHYPPDHEKAGEIIADTGIRNCNFSNCSFVNNNGHGINVESNPDLFSNNSAIGCTFSGNIAPSIRCKDARMLSRSNNVIHNERFAEEIAKE